MESLSGPLHSRNLSNGNGFSSKNAYDGVLFSGGQRKFGTPTFSAARAQDYREIFGSSTHGVSSIPVLDLSDFDDSSSNVRSSEPDYFKIFSGFKDDDVAVSHEELFGGVKGVRTSPEKKIRTPPATRQPSQDSGDLFDKSNQPVDAIKQFNMSYHKTTQRSNDGSNGTTHVAQLRDVPGFTCFIDEIKMAPEQKTETQSRKGSATNIVSPNVDFNEGIYEVKNSKKSMLDMGNERTSGNTVKSKIKYSRAGSFFDEKLFNVHEINLGSHPSKLPPPSRDATSLDGHQTPSNGPTASKSRESKTKVQERSRGDLSPPSDEELDINSAAAASAAALRKAIEKAQESIRIAKESVGRKKAGLQSFSNRSFKDSLKVKGIIDNVEACEKVGAGSEGFAQMERKDAFRDGAVYPGFKNGEKLFVARKVIGELHEKISESARKSEMSNWYAPELKQSDNVPMAKEVSGEMNGKNLDSAEKCKAATWVSDRANMEMGKADGLAFEQADSENVFLESADKFESKAKEIRTTNVTLKEKFVKKAEAGEKACELEGMKRKQNVVEDRLESSCADDKKENGIAGSEQEEETNREEPRGFFKLVNFVKNLRGFGDKTEEDQRVFDKLKTNDYEVRLNGSHELMHGNELKDFEEMMGSDQKEPQESQQQQKTFEEECEGDAENETGLGMNCNHNLADQVLEELSQWVETGPKEADASEERKQEDFHQVEAVEKWLDEVQELAINDKTPTYAHDFDESDDRMLNEFKVERSDAQEGENIEKRSEGSDANVEKESKEALKQKCGREEENHDKVAEDYMYEERESILVEARESIPSKAGGNQENGKVEIPQEVSCEEFLNRDCDNLSHDASSIAAESQDSCKIEIEINDNSCTPGVTEVFCEFKDEKAETIEVTNKVQEKEILAAANEIAAEDKEIEFEVIEVHEDFSPYHNVVESNVADTEVRENEIGQSDEQSDSADGIDTVSNESTQIEEIINQEKTAFSEEQVKHTPERADIHEEAKTLEIKDELQRSQYRERKEDSHNKTTDGWKAKENEDSLYKTTDGWKAKENEPRKEEEKKHLKEVDEATKRQWEREKDKIAVERAIREVRERAFAEARERAERAAVEKATAEARQRVMAEAREKIGKVAAAAKSSSEKASVEAKLRAERAAVERATAEARERALEKAMSQKMTSSRSESELFSGASRDHGNRQSSSSSDLHGSNGTNVESAQRSKARLETHNRIMERAAKALAEKEKRDHLAQKEQAERNRLAETLDADIKRWSSGKEGNLRALLSTLQCILGTESGWQPVSLTEIITTSAVKKAYRKATLCVHPDKLQQRGASIQQKYICEKVFDLLKAAWNRFHSEER